jgi:hypothetical protein
VDQFFLFQTVALTRLPASTPVRPGLPSLKTYRVATEVWNACDPRAEATTFAQSRRDFGRSGLTRGSGLIRGWWAAWLVFLALVNVEALLVHPDDVNVPLSVMSAAATFVAATLSVLVVMSISGRQDARWRQLTQTVSVEPTAPNRLAGQS